MKSPAVRWVTSLPAAMFYCLAAAGLHRNLDSPNGLAALMAWLAGGFLASSMALWVQADARRRQWPLPYDFSSFVFFAWPVLVPFYLFSTRGWRGLIALAGFFVLYVAATVISIIPWLIGVIPWLLGRSR